MSRETYSKDVEFTCPHCKARNNATLWPRIDAESAPEIMDQLYAGTLFDHVCFHCHQPTALDHTVLIEFVPSQTAILNSPPNDPLAEAVKSSDAALAGYHLRRVTDSNTLRELALVIRDGLDDAGMLLLKHMLAARVMDDRGEPPVLCNYESTMRDGQRQWFEYVLFQNEESEPETLAVPMSAYESVLEVAREKREWACPCGEWIDWDEDSARKLWEGKTSVDQPIREMEESL